MPPEPRADRDCSSYPPPRFRQSVGSGSRGLEIVNDGEILIEIRKQQHRQVKTAALHAELGLLQVALLLLGLNPCFDHVGVSDLAAILQFLADF